MSTIHSKGEGLLSTKLGPTMAKAFGKAAKRKGLTPAQWRSLIFNATTPYTRARLDAADWTPDHIVHLIQTDSKQLAPPSILLQRTPKVIHSTPTGTHCPACHKDTLIVEYVYRSTGPGRKREEVRIANCSHCHHKEVPE